MDIGAKQIHTQIKGDSFSLSSFKNCVSHPNTEQLHLSFHPLMTTLRTKSNFLLQELLYGTKKPSDIVGFNNGT